MGIFLNDLMSLSPCLYHVTSEKSLQRIKRLKCLQSASVLMEAGNQLHWLRQRRDRIVTFFVDGDEINLTDQLPINEKNIDFQGGWRLPDLIEALNRRVFFWRGPRRGLLKSNQGHFKKYDAAGHRLVFLRLSFGETFKINLPRCPELCKYNSGAARMNDGLPIPRGPDTFVLPPQAAFDVGDVQEVVYQESVKLPATTEFCEGSWEGPWERLFA